MPKKQNSKKIHKSRKKLSSSKKFPSELRFDLTSEDWVVIATGRAKRLKAFKKKKKKEKGIPKKNCPFCNLKTQKSPVLVYPGTVVIPNKFPSFLPQPKWEKKIEGGLYETMNAVGFCELVITKDHEKSLALLPLENVKEVVDCYHERYLKLKKLPFVNYISIFHNHGPEAGASQPHPHSQIITTPLIDIDLRKALINSRNYFKKNRKCLYCTMNEWEMKVKKRIVFENKDFLAICPFASKSAFEVIISPKKHLPYFEKITEEEKLSFAEALKACLNKIYKTLNNPSYNFYLKTSPCDGKDYSFYHWHFTILPKTGIWAGFEIGTQMEISTIEPEKAAAYLRKQK